MNKKYPLKNAALSLVGTICLLFPHLSFSQQDTAQKYAATITRDDLKKHVTIIASDEMEGRETGTGGQRKAAAYIENQFKVLGLQTPALLTGYQQIYPIFKDSILSTIIRVGKKKYLLGEDFILNPQAAQNEEIKAKKIIFAGYGITDTGYDDYKGKDVAGKVVVFFTGEPRADGKYLVSGNSKSSEWSYPGISRKTALAKRNGAVAALIINPAMENIPKDFAETARKSNVYFPSEEIPEITVNYATVAHSVAREIFGETLFTEMVKKASAGVALNDVVAEVKSKIKFDYKKRRIPYFASNVVGFVEGGDKKDEFVFLTAHYDHLGKVAAKTYYGADDDGSGTVSVIEMAEAFSKAKAEGNGPRRSIVFMTVSGEEKGLWGSKYYVDHPLFPLEKTTVDLNTDMVGRVDPGRTTGDSMNYVYVIGDDKLSTDLKPISTSVNSKYSRLELDYKFNDPDDPEQIFYRSDHYNFAKNGVPIIFYFDGIHGDYHRTSDTVDKINFDLMEKRVRFIFLTAWEMANRDNMLKRDIPLPQREE